MTEPIYESLIPSNVRSRVTQHGIRISPSDSLRKLEPGKSFTVDTDAHRRTVIAAAYRLGIPIRTGKDENGAGYRIWRKE